MKTFRSNPRALAASLAAILLSVLTLPALASESINTDKTGLAIDGYDPVAYFVAGEPQKGDFMISSTHGDATYWFVNEANKQAFDANPTRYLPQYGGYCAFGAALGKKFNGDPQVWTVIDDKLYLNLHEKIAAKFSDGTADLIAQANANWEKIKDTPAGEIE